MPIAAFKPPGIYPSSLPPAVLANTAVTTAVVLASATQVITAPSGIAAGNFLLLIYATTTNSGGPNVTFLEPAGWTWGGEVSNGLCGCGFFYKIADGSEGNVTITNARAAQEHIACYYQRYTGVDPTDPINSSGGFYYTGSTSSFAPSGSGLTTTVANCLGVGVLVTRANETRAITVSGTGWSEVRQDSGSGGTNLVACLTAKTMTAVGTQADVSFAFGSTSSEGAFLALALNPAGVVHPTVPVIASYQKTHNIVAQTSGITLVAPSGITAGDLLVLVVNVFSGAAGPVVTTPGGGWNLVREEGNSSIDVHTAIYYKVASGSEGNVAITHAGSAYSCGWYLRITGATTLDSTAGLEDATSGAVVPLTVIPTTTQNNCIVIGGITARDQVTGVQRILGGNSRVVDTGISGPASGNAVAACLVAMRIPLTNTPTSKVLFHNARDEAFFYHCTVMAAFR